MLHQYETGFSVDDRASEKTWQIDEVEFRIAKRTNKGVKNSDSNTTGASGSWIGDDADSAKGADRANSALSTKSAQLTTETRPDGRSFVTKK